MQKSDGFFRRHQKTKEAFSYVFMSTLRICACAWVTELKHTCSNRARAQDVYRAWAQYSALTLVKHTFWVNKTWAWYGCMVWVCTKALHTLLKKHPTCCPFLPIHNHLKMIMIKLKLAHSYSLHLESPFLEVLNCPSSHRSSPFYSGKSQILKKINRWWWSSPIEEGILKSSTQSSASLLSLLLHHVWYKVRVARLRTAWAGWERVWESGGWGEGQRGRIEGVKVEQAPLWGLSFSAALLWGDILFLSLSVSVSQFFFSFFLFFFIFWCSFFASDSFSPFLWSFFCVFFLSCQVCWAGAPSLSLLSLSLQSSA